MLNCLRKIVSQVKLGDGGMPFRVLQRDGILIFREVGPTQGEKWNFTAHILTLFILSHSVGKSFISVLPEIQPW